VRVMDLELQDLGADEVVPQETIGADGSAEGLLDVPRHSVVEPHRVAGASLLDDDDRTGGRMGRGRPGSAHGRPLLALLQAVLAATVALGATSAEHHG